MVTQSNQNLEMVAGDTKTLNITVTTDGSTAKNLSDVTAAGYKIARSPSAAADVSLTLGSGITIVDAGAGRIDIALASSDTDDLVGKFYHELELTDSGGNVATAFTGAITILADAV